MLARSFKTAAELGLTDKQWSSLITVLHMLERGEVQYPPNGEGDGFCMSEWDCGTAACMGGWANRFGAGFPYLFGNVRVFSSKVYELFMATEAGVPLRAISPTQAAAALSNYLVTGKPNWPDAMRAVTPQKGTEP